MRVNEHMRCLDFPCTDVRHECYVVPDVEARPETSIVLISEAAPADHGDYYYAPGNPLFQQTTEIGRAHV